MRRPGDERCERAPQPSRRVRGDVVPADDTAGANARTSAFGTYSYALAWVMLLGAPAVLGMDQLLVREVAAYSVKSRWDLPRGILRAANWTVLIVSLTLAAIAATVAWVLRQRTEPELVNTFWVGLLLIPLISLTRLRQATLLRDCTGWYSARFPSD